MSDIWENAINLTLNTPLTGTWSGAVNDYQFAANTTFTGVGQTATIATGADVVYKFTAPSAGNYSFRVTPPTTSAPNIVLYALNSIPTTTPGTPINIDPANVLAGANRTGTGTVAEEVYNLSLSANQTIYLVADIASGTSTVGFTVEVNPAVTETESNNTPATANPLVFGVEGSINPVGDVDYYSLGTPPSGSRVFAMIDGLAGSDGDFDLRVTTATDTLEYDDLDGDAPFGGSFPPSIAGTPLTGVASYLQVTRYLNGTPSEPYRLYSVVQPGIASATSETEGNDTLNTANSAANNYFYGALSSTTDVDFYAFTARAGDLVFLSLDGDPLRNNTPFDGRLALLDSNNTILVNVNGSGGVSSTTSGAGNLTADTPNYPSEGLVYRIRTDGTYYARVNAASTTFGDYLLSISLNGIAVTPNTAPVLDNTGNLTLTAITEDVVAANNPGTLVSDIIGNSVTDADPNALKGIAVTAVDNSNGTWQYTLDGTTWTNFGTPGLTAARLLPANSTARIRLLSNANFSGRADINFYAWDQTSGTAGNTANILLGKGGTTAFSTNYEGASITVTPVNDAAPTLAAGTPTLPNIDEDIPNANNKGTLLADLVKNLITDSDKDPQGIALTGLDNSNGKWQYSLDGGSTWTDFGTVADNSATVLSAGIKLYDGSLGTLPTSQGWLKFGASAAIPPLVGVGGTESAISGGTRLDSNTTASFPFSQLSGAAGYSNYNAYTPDLYNPSFPELDPLKGFTLSFDVKINSNQNTSDDNSDGIIDRAGFSVIVVTKDKTKAIELGFWTDEIWAQTATPLFTHSTTERAFINTSSTVTSYNLVVENNTYKLFAAGSSTPILTGNLRDYSAFNHTTAAPSPINSLPFDPYETPNFIFFGDNTTSATAVSDLTRVELYTNNRVRFVPNPNYNGQANLTFRAWDGSNGVASGTTGVNATINGNTTAFSSSTLNANITVNSVNDAPTLTNLIPDQISTTGSVFSYTIPNNSFNDVEDGSNLTYSATLENGSALPTWLTFNPTTRSFSGTPPTLGTLNIKVTATDSANASVTDIFTLKINNGIQGTTGLDILNGTSSDDSINGVDGNDRLFGRAGNDILDGGTGIDYISGGLGNDTIFGGAGADNDYLYGNEGNDYLDGGDGSDNIDGGTGDDILIGGTGSDIYVVDSLGDTITELANEGIDQVNSSITWTLGDHLENLVLTGNAAINGTGNSLNNQITGNSGNNILDGGDGDDWLLGEGGNDTLTGGEGNDRLDGGSGDDSLVGGNGNDLYVINSINDVIVEQSNAGIDTVISFIDYTLDANSHLENLNLLGNAITGGGNELNNRIIGNSQNNILFGADGNDYLSGEAGDDLLMGDVGNDTLVGGGGADVFDLFGTRTTGFDTIIDFRVNQDTILLDAGEFALTQAPGQLSADSFRLGTAATTSSDRFIYNQNTGVLLFDADGNGAGAAVQIAFFSNRAALSSASFEVSPGLL